MLLLVTGLFAFLALQQTQVERARGEARAAADQKVVELLSYDHRTIATDIGARMALLTGQFKEDYGALLRDVVIPAATQQQLTTRSSVVSSSVAGDDGIDQVQVVMFLNQTTQSSASPDPTLSGSRLHVTMEKKDGDWLVAELTPV
ncbi:hypothetical protein ACQP04_35690 [Pseudonocardia halophobica]|uniref:hypothetical protein n=1 Tax=Pseudonocardia halophobica TaxID=29401 RepID=UPI003D8A857F